MSGDVHETTFASRLSTRCTSSKRGERLLGGSRLLRRWGRPGESVGRRVRGIGAARSARSVHLSPVGRRRADAAWLNRSDGRAPSRPDRVLRPLRGAAQRCRSGGAHPRGVGGRRQRRRGRPRGGRHLRRARERRARVHEVDARALSAARRGRAAGPQATCGRLTPSAFADSRRPAAPGKAGWRSPGTPVKGAITRVAPQAAAR